MKKLDAARIKRYSQTRDAGFAYFLSCQREDGSFLPDGDRNDASYYNVYYMLYLAGAYSAAKKYHDWTLDAITDPLDGLQYINPRGVWASRASYFKGWCAYGAHLCGFYDQSLRVYRGLQRFIDRDWGGCYLSEEGARERTVMEFTGTGTVAMAMLAMGQMGEAHKIGEYMLRMVFEQPDIQSGFFGYMSGKDGKIITEGDFKPLLLYGFEDKESSTSDTAGDFDQYRFLYSAKEDYQAWACFGPPMEFIMDMYAASADKRYLEAAGRIFELFHISRAHKSLEFVSSCKMLQGLPQLYLATGDERVYDDIVTLCDYLASMQRSNGMWLKETLTGLGHMLRDDEQDAWIKPIQTGDVTLSFANVLKYLG